MGKADRLPLFRAGVRVWVACRARLDPGERRPNCDDVSVEGDASVGEPVAYFVEVVQVVVADPLHHPGVPNVADGPCRGRGGVAPGVFTLVNHIACWLHPVPPGRRGCGWVSGIPVVCIGKLLVRFCEVEWLVGLLQGCDIRSASGRGVTVRSTAAACRRSGAPRRRRWASGVPGRPGPRTQRHLSGECAHVSVLGDHGLQVVDPVAQDVAGGSGEDEQDPGNTGYQRSQTAPGTTGCRERWRPAGCGWYDHSRA